MFLVLQKVIGRKCQKWRKKMILWYFSRRASFRIQHQPTYRLDKDNIFFYIDEGDLLHLIKEWKSNQNFFFPLSRQDKNYKNNFIFSYFSNCALLNNDGKYFQTNKIFRLFFFFYIFLIRFSYNFVAKETTGKDFLIERHFSLSINRELDLIFRSCSSRALFWRSVWNIKS